jgi:hypothetical protein
MAFSTALQAEGYAVWIELRHVDPYKDFTSEIERGISKADLVLVLLSAEGTKPNSFLRREVIYALSLSKEIIPIRLSDNAKTPITLVSFPSYTLGEGFGIKDAIKIIKTRLATLSLNATNKKEIVFDDTHRIHRDKSPLERVFIAYSRKQREIAEDIYNLLLKSGKEAFYDAKIKAGATWRQTIQKALDDATHLVVIWTPEAAESDEVEREVSYALAERKVIVPILSKEIPKLPYHLHGLHYIVLEEDVSKIEADLLKAIAQFSDGEDIWQ